MIIFFGIKPLDRKRERELGPMPLNIPNLHIKLLINKNDVKAISINSTFIT